MELDIQFETKVTLTAKDMGKDITDVDKILTKKITEQYEGRCSRNGYVLPNSVKMISRSMGMVEKGRYTGDILFYAEASAKVLQPPDGIVIEGTVIRQNRMGMYIDYQGAIRVMVPRDLNIGDVEFNDSVKVGDTVRVEIKKSRYQVNDTSILSVGIFKGKVKGAAGEAAVEEAAAEEKKEEEFTEVDVDAAEAEADAVATAEEDEEGAEGAEDNAEEEEEEDESN